MSDATIYLLKVAAGIGLIATPYYLFLRNDSALRVKRFYLLIGILLSWIFPLLTIQKPELVSEIEPVLLIDLRDNISTQNTTAPAHSFISPIWFIYITGIFILLIRILLGFVKINTFKRTSLSKNNRIFIIDQKEAFTFFRHIFIPARYEDQFDKESILIHEEAHIMQMHFIDTLIAELSLLFTWFNPFSWLISRMIKENHEHLADRAVLSKGVHPGRYKALLLNHVMGMQVIRLGHQFNHSLTKKRFKMMKKSNSNRKGLVKYALIIPAILSFTLIATATCQTKTKQISGQVFASSKEDPAPGASVIIVGTTIGTVTDLEGKFALEVEGNPDISISFVGFETIQIPAKKADKGSFILEPTTYEISLKDIQQQEAEDEVFLKIIGSKSGKKPVLILDGEVIDNMDDINPDDLASISVIKDLDDPICKKHNATAGVMVLTSKKKKDEVKNPVEEEEVIFYIVEDMPSFPGGKEALKSYIDEHLVYPKIASENGIQGDVVVNFVVSTTGALEDINVIRSVDPSLDKAALEVFKNMPAWKPAKQRGKTVKVKVNVVVPFVLAE